MHPDDRLRQLCAPVITIDDTLRALCADMFDTLYHAKGRGLAAPQIGQLIRLFVMDATWKFGDPTPMVFVNPELLSSAADLQTNEEACLSIADFSASIARPARIEAMWLDEHGAQQRGAFEGFEAACICHEIDHLNGTLILDRRAAA